MATPNDPNLLPWLSDNGITTMATLPIGAVSTGSTSLGYVAMPAQMPIAVPPPMQPHAPFSPMPPPASPMFNEHGVVGWHGDVIVLWYIGTSGADEDFFFRNRKVMEYKVPVGLPADSNRSVQWLNIPMNSYRTREEAQQALQKEVRERYSSILGKFLEQLVLAGFEQGMCEEPETDLASAMQKYLEAIK